MMEKRKLHMNKFISCWMVIAMIAAAIFAIPTMNAQAATKKAAMSKTSVPLIVDKTCTLSVNNAKGKATWSTSDKKVATVSKTGDRSAKITAKKTGTATIIAKIGSKKYTCKVKAENPKLSATTKTLNTKDTKTATIQLNSTSQGSSVTWATSNSKIVSIKASKNKVTMTAKKAGKATVTATVGDKKFSCKVTVEKSHNYKKDKTVAATCAKKGYTEYKCACGKPYKKEIAATGKHDYSVKGETVVATCTTDGYTVYKCKNCSKTTKKTTKASHDWDEGVVTAEPTCSCTGEKLYTCKTCGETKTEVIPATKDHIWGEASEDIEVNEEKTVPLYTCSGCGFATTSSDLIGDHMAAVEFGEAAGNHPEYDGTGKSEIIESTNVVEHHFFGKASGHYEKEDGSEKLYVCSKCGSTYTKED